MPKAFIRREKDEYWAFDEDTEDFLDSDVDKNKLIGRLKMKKYVTEGDE